MSELLADQAVSEALLQEELFPIREVSRLTGINPVTLRAWERRYGLIQPTRTDSGHRLYSQTDIDDVRSVLGWIERGVAVSKVGKLLARAQTARAEVRATPADAGSEAHEWQLQLRHAISAFDERQLDHLYGQIFASYPVYVVFHDVLMPLWRELRADGEHWGRTSEWLFLDTFLRGRVMLRLQLARATQTGQRLVLAAVPGQCLELELWVTGLLMAGADTSVTVLASGQPLEELGLICEKVKPQALVLFSSQRAAGDLPKRLVRLGLSLNCPLLLAGETADLEQDRLDGTPIGCLGSDTRVMQRRLQQFLGDRLDT